MERTARTKRTRVYIPKKYPCPTLRSPTSRAEEQAATEIFALYQLSYTSLAVRGGTRTRDLVISIEVTVTYAIGPTRNPAGTSGCGLGARPIFFEKK